MGVGTGVGGVASVSAGVGVVVGIDVGGGMVYEMSTFLSAAPLFNVPYTKPTHSRV